MTTKKRNPDASADATDMEASAVADAPAPPGDAPPGDAPKADAPQGGAPPAAAPPLAGEQEPNRLVGTLFTSLRVLLPLLEEYSRSKAPGEQIETGAAGRLSEDERRVLTGAASKLVYEGAAVLRSTSDLGNVAMPQKDVQTGRFPALTAVDGILALRAIRSLVSTPKASEPTAAPAAAQVALKGEATPPAADSVHEHPASSARSPQQIRSFAMQQKNVSSPPAQAAARQSQQQAGVRNTVTKPTQSSGCSCGSAQSQPTSGGSCRRCGQPATAALAVRNEEGKCEPSPFEISCETQLRLKQCIKSVICDTLWCFEGHLCPNGQPDLSGLNSAALKECLGTALCSLIRCVPEVLCPPQNQCDTSPPRATIDCAYAVEELP